MLVDKPEDNGFRYYCEKLLHDILLVSLVTFTIFLTLENLKTGLISNYFDINLLLIAAVFSGVCLLLLKKGNSQIFEKKTPFTLFFISIIIYLSLIYLVLDISHFIKIILMASLFFSLLIYYKKYDQVDKN